MLIAAFRSMFVLETLPGGLFIRLPFIGQAHIEHSSTNTSLPFSTENFGGEVLGYWGRLRWVFSPWKVTARECRPKAA